jgi:hypothetical protein
VEGNVFAPRRNSLIISNCSSIELLLVSLWDMISRWSRALGLDWAAFYTGLKGLRRFWADYRQIAALNIAAGQPWKIRASYPLGRGCK